MLSVEQRHFTDAYQFRGVMRNIAYVSGFARYVSSRGGYIQQTRNENLMIPFMVDKGDSVPGWVQDQGIVKVVARVVGVKLPSGHRVCVLRTLRFETPSILELPPEAAWENSPTPGAPRSEFVPKFGQAGLPFTKRSNEIHLAGFAAGVMLDRAGTPKEGGGERSDDRLLILLQQTKSPDDAIPIRMYGKHTGANGSRIRLGTPLCFRKAEIRIDAKGTGEMEEGSIEKAMKYAYIKSGVQISIATRDDIQIQPDRAVRLAIEGRKKVAQTESARPAKA
jgi:hypothetical protein